MWSFQFLTSYLPTYYITEVGLSIKYASNITAVFPLAGIIAGLHVVPHCKAGGSFSTTYISLNVASLVLGMSASVLLKRKSA